MRSEDSSHARNVHDHSKHPLTLDYPVARDLDTHAKGINNTRAGSAAAEQEAA